MTTKTSKLPAYCVYQDGWTEHYRDMGIGDGLTRPNRLLVATCDTEAEAEAIKGKLARIAERIPLIPGNGKSRPTFETGSYDPLDFVGSQNRDEYTGTRYAALCGRLADEAKTRFAEFVA